MKLIKKWLYFAVFLLAGLYYLNFVDHWKVYQTLYKNAEQYFQDLPEEIIAPELPQNFVSFWDSLPEIPKLNIENSKDNTVSGNSVSGNRVVVTTTTVSGNEVIVTETIVEESIEPEESSEPVESSETEESSEVFEEVPELTSVDEEYFRDAVFIGDSRTVGLAEYSGMKEYTTFYAATGLSVYSVFSSKCIEVPGEKNKITIEDALSRNKFKKVYIMLGINELGTGTAKSFAAKYKTVLERIQELQPDAIIYLQGILHVSEKKAKQGDVFNNVNIEERNAALQELAQEMGIYYLDVNPAVCDENGFLNSEYTNDGIHLKARSVSYWKEFLMNNAMVK